MSLSISPQAATQSPIGQSATSVTLFAATTGNIKRRTIYNDSDGVLYVSINGAASTTNYIVRMAAGSYWEMPLPTFGGTVTGIWTGGTTGGAKVASY